MRLLLEHGGRCALCNRWLAYDPNFFISGNYRETAHIIAAAKDGPRGNLENLTETELHSIENLIPLCMDDHKTMDGPSKGDYPPEKLRRIKAEHAQAIRHLCDQASLQPSLIVKCQAHIGSAKVSITPNVIAMALNGKRPYDSHGILIDFSSLSGTETPETLKERASEIDRQIKRGLDPKVSAAFVTHLSVFAIGPIPLLVSLGASISRAFPTDYFHYHSAHQTWAWPKNGQKIDFEYKLVRAGSSPEAAILISCSGTILPEDIEKYTPSGTWVFLITPVGVEPCLNLIDHPDSIVSFINAYDALRAEIRRRVVGLRKIHLFQAAPPALAIISGQHLLAKVDPPVTVYDYRKNDSTFVSILEVNVL